MFGRKRDPLRQLKQRLVREQTQTNIAVGMPPDQAAQIAEASVDEAVRRSQESGAPDLPPGAGDRLLAQEATDEEVHSMLAKKRAQGATNADIRWWWNLHDIEKHLLLLQDEAAKFGVYTYWLDQGLSEEDAARMAERMVNYGDPEDTSRWSGDDRPLPFELKDRANRFMLSLGPDADEARRRIDAFSSANAFIRAEMRAGRFPQE
jgi:hypothetical protein